MPEELYPGQSFAAPFQEAQFASQLAGVPTEILQTIQSARSQARADEALRLKQEEAALARQSVLRRREQEDIDRELAGQIGIGATAPRRGSRGGAQGGLELGPAGTASAGLSKGSSGRAALAPQVAEEQAIIQGGLSADEWIRDYGLRAQEEHDAYRRQQEALESQKDRLASSPLKTWSPEAGRRERQIVAGAERLGGELPSTAQALLEWVGTSRQASGSPAFHSPDAIADLLVQKEQELIAQGHPDLDDATMAGLVQEVFRQGPPPPRDDSMIEGAVGVMFDEGWDDLSEWDARARVESAGFHPSQIDEVVERVQTMSPDDRAGRVLQSMGIMEEGGELLVESDMELNPASQVGLPSDYSRSPEKFTYQLYRTPWGRGLSGQRRSELIEEYRGWYKDRISDRRADLARRMRESAEEQALAAADAFEAEVQSVFDMYRSGKGSLPSEIRNDDEKLWAAAVGFVKESPAHQEFVKNWTTLTSQRIESGPGYARERRQEKARKRKVETEDARAQDVYNDLMAKVQKNPDYADAFDTYGVVFVGGDGNYRPRDEILRDLRAARAQYGDEVAPLFEAIERDVGAAHTAGEARRGQTVPEETPPSAEGTTASQKLRGLSEIRRIRDQAYLRAVRAAKVPKHLTDELERVSEAAFTGADQASRGRAEDRARELRAEIAAFEEVRNIKWDDDSLLTAGELDHVSQIRSVSGLEAEVGGGGGRAPNPSPGPGYKKRTTKTGKDIWYNAETRESQPYWAGE